MAKKYDYEGGKPPSQQSESEKKLNADIRKAFSRGRVSQTADLPTNAEPKPQEQAEPEKWPGWEGHPDG